MRALRTWYAQRSLTLALTRREIEGRYRGSILGVLWSFLNPLILMLIYTVIFSFVFKMNWSEEYQGFGIFALMLFCGLIPFNFLGEVLGKGPRLIVNCPNYVRRIAFPVEILPVVAVNSALFHALISTAILLAGVLLIHGSLPLTVLLLPLLWIPYYVFMIIVAFTTATIGVFIRDIEHIAGLLMSVLFFATPIFYSLDRVPESWRWLVHLNPVADMAIGIRQVAIYGVIPDLSLWGWFSVCSILLLAAVLAWFEIIKRRFADVV